MWTRMVFPLTVALMVLPLAAQTTTRPATHPAATTAPAVSEGPVVRAGVIEDVVVATPAGAVVGEVTGSNVYVRSGPSTTGAYPCAKAHKPEKVTVVEVKGEWLKILPTTGCFSVISKQFVKPDESGKTGTVTGDNVWTRAGGELCLSTWTSWKEFWQLHRQLNTGQKVQILGTAGDFYKITPPEECCYWISAKFVDLGGKMPAKAAETDNNGVTVTAHENERGEISGHIVAQAPQATTIPAADTSAARAQFDAVEKELQAEYKKPADQRDLKGLIDKYLAIKTAGSDRLKGYVDARVKYLQNQLKNYEEAKQWQEALRNIQEDQKKTKAALAQIKAEEVKPLATAFAADGVLTPSGLFPGNEVSPKRYVVRDPDTNRITAYVQCTTSDLNLEEYANKHVGITGSTQYDRDLGLYIVEAKELKVLKEDAKLQDPAQPVVRPLPKEEPPVELKTPTAVQPASQPAPKATATPAAPEKAAAAPAKAGKVQEEQENEMSAAAKAAGEKPDMGDDPAAPGTLPNPSAETRPATATTAPADKATQGEPLPENGLKVADQK